MQEIIKPIPFTIDKNRSRSLLANREQPIVIHPEGSYGMSVLFKAIEPLFSKQRAIKNAARTVLERLYSGE